MPTISRFYGIVIGMYFGDHPPPHIHVSYAEDEGRIAFRTGEVLTGDLPGRIVNMVVEWCKLRQAEVGAQLGTGAGQDAPRTGRAASVKIAPRMAAAVPMDAYVVRVLFVDGEVRDVDVEPMLDGPVFGPLRDPEIFRAVTVDPETRTITWPGGADLDPDVIYDPSLRSDTGGARITTPARVA